MVNHINNYFTVHVAANLNKVKDLKTPLSPLTEKIIELKQPTIDYLPSTLDSKLMNLSGNLEKDFTGTIVGVGCIESGFLFHTSPGIIDFLDQDYAVLLLYLQYLSQLEGPMWKKIRKSSYGYNVVPRPNEGLIVFTLYKATNMYEAFKDAKQIVEAQAAEGSEFDSTLLDSAKSSLIFEIIEREKTVGDLVQQAMLNSFKGVSKDYNKNLVDQISTITVDDLRRVGEKYLKQMFKASTAKIAIVCHPERVDAVKTQFEEFGHNLMESSSLETSILNSGCM